MWFQKTNIRLFSKVPVSLPHAPAAHSYFLLCTVWLCFLTLTVAILGPPVNGCSSLPERKLTHSKMHKFSARRVRWISSQVWRVPQVMKKLSITDQSRGRMKTVSHFLKLLMKIYHDTGRLAPHYFCLLKLKAPLPWPSWPLNSGIPSACSRPTVLLCTALNHT